MHEDSGRTFTRDPWRAPGPGSSPGLTAQPEWAAARRLSTARPSEKGGSSLLDKTLELLQIRREEAPLALLVTLYFFLALASVSMIKSVQNAFYLGRVGFDWRLPSLYVVLALISGLGVVFYRRLSHRFSRVAINGATLVALILSLIAFIPLFPGGSSWTYILFYVWGGIFSILVPTQGWMLAYQLYATRKAKRIFGLLGTGGILGGAGGGYYAAWMGRSDVQAEGLLTQVAVMLGLMALLMALIARQGRRDSAGVRQHPGAVVSSADGVTGTLRFIFQSPYLASLAGVVLASACVTTVVDLLYKQVLEEEFSGSPGEITQFFGGLLGTIFVFSALFQLLGTNRVIRRFGIGVGLLLLPLTIMGANILVLIVGAFWTVIGLKIADGCLRSSLHKTSLELLYVPITDTRTLTVKGLIDLAVFRLGDALGATLFLALASLPGPALLWVGSGALLASVAWAALSWNIGGEYVRVLRRSLEVRPTPSARRALNLREKAAETTLVEALQSESDSKVRFALHQLLEGWADRQDELLAEVLTEGTELASQSDDIVLPRFTGDGPTEVPPWVASVEPLLEHPEPEIAAIALHLLILLDPERHLGQLRQACSSREIPDPVCLYFLVRFGLPRQSQLASETLQRWAREASPRHAELLARLMGRLGRKEFVPTLLEWAERPERALATSALRALGQCRDPRQVRLLIQALSPHWSRSAARDALVSYGRPVLPDLLEVLASTKTKLEVRREIPQILARLSTDAAVEALVSSLYSSDPVISFRALRALNKIREKRGLPFGEFSFSPALQIWVREYYELLNLDILMEDRGDGPGRLARKVVRERLDRCTEKIFRGLELFLPPGDAYFSYLGFTGDAPELRENAIELIDLRIRGELRETILPIVTGYNQTEVAQKGRTLYRLPSDLERGFSEVLFQADPWLKCCIIATVKAEGISNLKDRVRQALEDIDPLVRETAQWALETWGTGPTES